MKDIVSIKKDFVSSQKMTKDITSNINDSKSFPLNINYLNDNGQDIVSGRDLTSNILDTIYFLFVIVYVNDM